MKRYMYLLTALLLLAVTLCGCKKEENLNEFEFEYVDEGPATNASENKPEDTMADAQATTDNVTIGSLDSYIGSQYQKTETLPFGFEIDEQYETEVSLDVPEIKDNSDAAKEINSEIYAMAKDSIEQVEAIINGTATEIYEPPYVRISYEAYLNDEILSIIVKYETSYSDWTDYGVYNYNVVTKEKAENEAILEKAGISEEQFVNMAKQSFGEIALPDIDDFVNGDTDNTAGLLDEPDTGESEAEEANEASEVNDNEEIVDLDELYGENWRASIVADYIRDYVETVNSKIINKDMPMFLDGNGELNAVSLVMVPAGAGQYYHVAKIEEKSNDEMIKKYCEYAEQLDYDEFEKQLLSLYDLEGYSGSIIRKITVSNMRSEDVYLGFDSNDTSVFTMQFSGDDFADSYLGKLEFESFDENGIIFNYVLDTKNDEALIDESSEEEVSDAEKIHTGRFYLNPYFVWDETEELYISGAIYKSIDGEDMLGANGSAVDFRKSFG